MWKKSLALLAGAVLTFTLAAPLPGVSASAGGVSSASAGESTAEMSYREYLARYAGEPEAAATIAVEGEAFTESAAGDSLMKEERYSGGAALKTMEGGVCAWQVEVAQAGLYCLRVTYGSLSDRKNSAVRALTVNGSLPFHEAGNLTFERSFSDVLETGDFAQDAYGNQISPDVQENDAVLIKYAQDAAGGSGLPLLFYFPAGRSEIRLEALRETLIIDKLELAPAPAAPTYEEKTAEYEAMGYKRAGNLAITVEAEKTAAKSAYSITPSTDRMSAATSPQDPGRICLNMLGGSKWSEVGQWVSWSFKVPEGGAGLYTLSARYRQDTLAGAYVSRELLLDGELPFAEAAALKFPYAGGWRSVTLGAEEGPYLFYLSEGKHTLTMRVVLGDMADILTRVKESLNSLNECYRKILAVTGPNPDINRDYDFPDLLPEVLARLEEQRGLLTEAAAEIEADSGTTGEQMAVIRKIISQLEGMAGKPATIARQFNTFKDNLAALGNWVFTMSTQPLELDSLTLAGEGAALPREEAPWYESLWFNVSLILRSFFSDYNQVGSLSMAGEGEALEVWVPTGRDQAQILRLMANSTFVKETGIPVNVKLVTADALLPATLTGRGPDVAISNAENVPVNYALRHAVLDLKAFPDWQEAAAQFYGSALIPFLYNGALYALPENQTFPMLFYRTDIFESLGLEPPETWDELYAVIPVIKKQNMDIGIQPGYAGMLTFMYQQGVPLYNDELTAVNFSSNEAVGCFKQICDLYTLYKLPVTYDFANRFRTGEMPLAITDYTAYNQLTVFAPEIQGLWEMVPIPATVGGNGERNGTAVSSSTGAMILKNTDRPEDAWKFLKWWTGAEAQSRFGVEMESVVGAAARQPTANKEALGALPWKYSDYQNLKAQFELTGGVPMVPGNYIVDREVGFAFTAVYNKGDNPIDALDEHIPVINDELSRKRKEFMVQR